MATLTITPELVILIISAIMGYYITGILYEKIQKKRLFKLAIENNKKRWNRRALRNL
jgi:uncharacterized membrane protein (DUF106 family)